MMSKLLNANQGEPMNMILSRLCGLLLLLLVPGFAHPPTGRHIPGFNIDSTQIHNVRSLMITSITEQDFTPHDSGDHLDAIETNNYTFETDGRIIRTFKRISAYDNHTILADTVTYDPFDRILENRYGVCVYDDTERVAISRSKEASKYFTTRIYDASYRLCEEINNHLKDTSRYTYDSLGHLLSEYHVLTMVHKRQQKTLQYDNNGRLAAITAQYGEDTGVFSSSTKVAFEYETIGNSLVTTTFQTWPWKEPFEKDIYDSAANVEVVSERDQFGDTLHPTTKRVKNAAGQLLEYYTISRGKEMLLERYIYQKDGMISSFEGYQTDGHLCARQRYTYTYAEK